MKKTLVTFLVIAVTAVVFAQDKVPLQIELPKPLFVGTPTPIKVPNLEKPSAAKRPDFLVPAGTVNLAKGKAVTASDAYPVIGELSFVTDGDKGGMDGSFVEFGPGVQWVQIDLGAKSPLSAIVLWHFHAQARVYHDVIVQVSDDPEFKKDVRTLYNNDHDNSAALGAGKDMAYVETNAGRLIDAQGARARYVRLYSNANTTDELNHYVEVEVYGQK
ncbi:discoidin domain-containing protein [Oleiharenicola lentus]|uniref:discoidin domain-containing protein n=1 Tax=Oleiharenicola lentus TaxID=2508720 RepID=UPI003F66716B